MRGCPDEGMLRGYLDGELPRGRAEAVASHLSACVACAAAYYEIEDGALILADALTPLTSMPVPAARLRERLDGAVGEPRSQARRDSSGFDPHAEPRLPAMLSSLSVPGGRPAGFAGLALILVIALVCAAPRGEFVVPEAGEGLPSSVSGDSARARQSAALEVGGREPLAAEPSRVTRGLADAAPTASRVAGYSVVRVNIVRAGVPAKHRPAPAAASQGARLLSEEKKYLDAIERAATPLNLDDASALKPSLRVEYERNLAVVDRAIAITRRAALDNPRDSVAAEFLLSSYRSKLDFLNSIVAQTRSETAEN